MIPQNVIGGLLLSVIGLFLTVNPHDVCKLTERWKTLSAAEASPAFVTVTRCVGAVCAVIGILVIFGFLR